MSANEKLKQIVEAVLLSAGSPLNLDAILELFLEEERPDKKMLREVIAALREDYEGRGIELVEVGSGFRINARSEFSPWVSRLWEERPARYSRALLETLALIAYRQPVTRGEIEDVRGVSVSTQIIKTLLEREWVRVVGQRDVPGRPSLYATTREFLNYFSLKGLGDLPTLQEIRDFDSINRELELGEPGAESSGSDDSGEANSAPYEADEQQECLGDGGEVVESVEVQEKIEVKEASTDEVLSDELTEARDEEERRDE
ncbi:MAG: SMC-Scp complex subunit ScpB [Candidatus Sedimenticola sp. (ex Thyasira tokunagai)]